MYIAIYAVVIVFIMASAVIRTNSLAYKVVWIVYAVIATASLACVVFQDQLLGHGGALDYWYNLSHTTLWGYLLLAACCFIAFQPFKAFGANDALASFATSVRDKKLMAIYAYILIAFSIVFICLSAGSISSALHTSDYGALRSDLFGNSENESSLVIATNPLANICFKLCLQFKYLSVFVVCGMLKSNYKKGLAVGLLAFTFFDYYIYTAANASRGGLLIFCLCTLVVIGTFFKYFSPSLKHALRISILVVSVAVFSYIAAVTISRFADDGGGGNAVVRNIAFYLGHAPIEFSRITGSLDHFANGDVILGRLANHYFGSFYSWDILALRIGYPQIGPLFVTYLGFIYCDLGPIGCLIFFSICSFLMNYLIRKCPNRPSTIFIFMYYMHYFITGAFVVGRLEYASLITSLVIWAALRVLEAVEIYYQDRKGKNWISPRDGDATCLG